DQLTSTEQVRDRGLPRRRIRSGMPRPNQPGGPIGSRWPESAHSPQPVEGPNPAMAAPAANVPVRRTDLARQSAYRADLEHARARAGDRFERHSRPDRLARAQAARAGARLRGVAIT